MKNKQGRREGEVWDACDELFAENRKLTLEQIQSKLEELSFDRGSPNYIYKYRKTWLDTKGMTMDDLQALHHTMEREGQRKTTNQDDLPKPLLRSFSLYVKEVTQQLQEKTQAELASLQEALSAEKLKVEGLIEACGNCSKENKELEKKLSALETIYSELDTKHERLRKAHERDEQQLASKSELIQVLRQKNEEQQQSFATRLHEQKTQSENALAKLEQHYQTEKSQLLDYQESQRQAQIVEKDAWLVKETKLEKMLQQSHEDNKQLEVKLGQLSEKCTTQEAALHEKQAAVKTAEHSLRELEKSFAKVEVENTSLLRQIEMLQSELTNTNAQRLKEKEQTIRLSAKLEQVEEKLKSADKVGA